MVEVRPQDRLQRRLAAILNADIVGYSRLMAADEAGTLARLKRLRQDIVAPAIATHGGRLFKEMGDGLLVDFASAVDAVECAMSIQTGMAQLGAEFSEESRIRYRIGINLGDVVVDGDDVFGDGVNVAARLQSLADPGGISISAVVYDQIRDKLPLGFDDTGDQPLKNIEKPVRVYRVLPSEGVRVAELAKEERDYRDAVRVRFATEATFYVPLTGGTSDAPRRPARAPRAALRSARRARVDYVELISTGEDIKPVKLDDIRSALLRYPCIIMVGDPGCGKSTTMQMLAFEGAGRPDKLPVYLRLSEFAPGSTPEAFIAQGWGGSTHAGHWGAPRLAANLKAHLEAGRLLLLLDGLNEMQQEGHRQRCEALRAFIDLWSARGNQFVVTCRSLDYGEELSGLQRVEVRPLGDEQIQQFLENELPEDALRLWQALQAGEDRHRLVEMARNPFLLTVMIDVFEEDGALSRNRAELLRRFTEIMLEWARAKCPANEWLDAELQIEALSVMAYEMQGRSGFGTQVKTESIKAVMPVSVQLDPNWPARSAPPDRVLALAAAANIIEMPVDRLSVRFYHQLLQEYFAARFMLRQDPASLAAYWRMPRLDSEMPGWSRPEGNYEPLPPPPATGWEETTLLAAAMTSGGDVNFIRAVAETNPVLAGRCIASSQGLAGNDLRRVVVGKLLAMIDDVRVSLRARIAAANVLGELGDPRPGAMVLVPAGAFLMGEGRERHEVSLPQYRIGRYPVTNAEYRLFMDAGGYKERRWWTDAGWLEIGQSQNQPRFWHDARFNKPNQPIMGLSWYECVAYCRWLSHESGGLLRLPTEAEWEKAARGCDGLLFPWGGEFDPARLNGRGPRDSQVCATTPVGIYPNGVSAFGLYDCAGNTWEWCSTRWKKPFPYDVAQDEWSADYLQGQNLRVLRGGSWYDTREATSCTHRFKFQPYGWNDRGGFRVVSPR
jgi:formylglycine-generating enzyme required for sulfatase activity/class 3 adenylate cyclase